MSDYPHNPPLERQWLHIQVIDKNVYVFLDDGHWKNAVDPICKEDWKSAKEFTLDDISGDCWLGHLDSDQNFRARIRLNTKICTGKFGMPYIEG